jgi:nitrite reductase (NADH) small subunit
MWLDAAAESCGLTSGVSLPLTERMPFLKVANLSQVPPGSVLEVMVGQQPYAICHTQGSVYALNGICPHRGGPLGQGQIHQGHVVCPYHLWEFDCRTGEYDLEPARRVATYEVKIEDGDIFLQVP